MDLEKIQFPEHLKQHNIPEATLREIPEGQRLVAIQWNISIRQNEWVIERLVTIWNLQVEHDKAITYWKTMCVAGGLLVSAYLAAQQMGFIK